MLCRRKPATERAEAPAMQCQRCGYVRQDGRIVGAECRRVGDVGDHDRPASPPGPARPPTERDSDDDDGEDAEDELIDRLGAPLPAWLTVSTTTGTLAAS